MPVTTLYGGARRAKGWVGVLDNEPSPVVCSPSPVPAERRSAEAIADARSERRLPGGMFAAHECVLTNARIVTADAVFMGTVQVRGGRIADIDAGTTGLSSVIDLQGDYLLPGLVDVHTDNLERHLQPRPGVVWPSAGALIAHDRQIAAAGITTVFDSLCVGDRDRGSAGRPVSVIESLRAMERAQAEGLLNSEHILHLRCEVSAEGVVESLGALIDDPSVRLVSLMDHTPGQRQWTDLANWRRFQRGNDLSDGDLQVIYDQRTSRGADLADAVRVQVAQMCRQRRLALASHDDANVDHVLQAADLGVTISEFPTTAAAARAARCEGMRVVMGAPNMVLNGSHSGNVSARELVAAGLVDGLASDYVPNSLIQACFLCHQLLGMPLPAASALVSAAPAAMVGLDDRGVIAPGKRADLLHVRLHGHMPVVCGVWRRGERVA